MFSFLKYYFLTSYKKSQFLLATPVRQQPSSSLFPYSLAFYIAVGTTLQYRLLLRYWQCSVLPWVFLRKGYIKGKKKLFNWTFYPQKKLTRRKLLTRVPRDLVSKDLGSRLTCLTTWVVFLLSLDSLKKKTMFQGCYQGKKRLTCFKGDSTVTIRMEGV